jgi:parallel beta-helix repeat protein
MPILIPPHLFSKISLLMILADDEGIWCGGSVKNDNPFFDIPKEVSNAVIRHNIISHNGLSGILLNGGIYDLYGNQILDNWLWGIMVKSQSSANIISNDIFENKCGGIRIGINSICGLSAFGTPKQIIIGYVTVTTGFH